jgi:hypothetical protein
VAWYRFENGTARDWTAFLDDDRFADTTPYDGTVNGASFVPNGGVRDVVSGPNSGAYSFDGVDDFIETVNMPSSVLGSESRTVTAWVDIDQQDTSSAKHILNFGNTSRGESFGAFILNDELTFYGFSSSFDFKTGFTNVFNNLFFLSITYDGSKVRTFVDGQPTSITGFSRALNTPSGPLVIGTRQDKLTDTFINQTANDVRIYNRALSASEINQIYTNTDPDQ